MDQSIRSCQGTPSCSKTWSQGMSEKPKVLKTRQREVAPREYGPTKPKAFTKETGRQLQDFSDDSFSECNEKGSVDQSLLVPSGLFRKDALFESALSIAILIKYTKDDPILQALTSKLRDDFAAEKQLVDDLEQFLQHSKEERKELVNYLAQVFFALRHSQRETECLKNELEKPGLRIGNKETLKNIKHKDEYDTLWREFHEEKETSQTPSQIYGQRDIGRRDIRMKLQNNLISIQNVNKNTMLESKLQLKQMLEEPGKTKVMLNEAVQEQEHEQALRKTLDQTVREDKTIIEQLKGECLKLSLSREELCEHYKAELSKIWAAFEQTRNEKDYALRQEQAAEKKATDLLNKSKILDEENQRLLHLHRQEIERHDEKIEKMRKMIKSERNDLRVENQLMMNSIEKERHQILIDKRNARAELCEFRSKYETERRKSQELQRQVNEYENKVKMLEYENENVMKSEKDEKRLLARLQKNVEEKDRDMQTLKKSLEEIKSDNSILRREIFDSKAQFSDKVTQLQKSLAVLKKTEDELQKTKNERDCAFVQRNAVERKVRELEKYNESSEKAYTEKLSEQKQLIERLETEINEVNTHAKLKISKEMDVRSDMDNLRKEFETTTGQLTKLKYEHAIAKTKLMGTENRLEYVRSDTIEEKDREFEKCIKILEETDTEKITKQNALIKRLETDLEHSNAKLKRLEEIHVKSDTDNLRKELITIKEQSMKLKYEHKLVVTKLKETEEKLDAAKNENQIEHQTRQKLESKALELENYIIVLTEANQHHESEAELKDSKLQELEVSLESLRQSSIENKQQRNLDFQKNVEQLSELRRREETILEELNNARLQLNKSQSETEIEKHRVKELEKSVNVYENQIKQSRDENDEIFRIRNERLAQLEKEVKKRDREQENLAKFLEQTKHQNIEQLKHIHTLTDTTEQLRKQLQTAENKLQKTVEREHEVTKTLESKIKEFDDGSKQFEEIGKKVISQDQRIQYFEKDTVCKDRKIKDLEQSLENASSEIDKKDQFMQDLKETKEYLNLLKEKDRAIQTLKTSLEEIKSENSHLRKNISESNAQVTQMQQSLTLLKGSQEELQKIKNERDREYEHRNENERKVRELEKCIENLEQTNKEKVREQKLLIESLKENLEHTNAQLKRSLESASREINDKHQITQALKETKDKLSTTSYQQKQALAKLKETEAELKAAKTSNDDLQSNMNGMSELRGQLQRALSKLEKTEIELEDTKTRLSKAMGDKLTDNNPNIADFSDKNRPVKLAEMYCELYDNQWTDAYAVLEKRFEREQHIIESLFEILQDASHFCEVNAVKQLTDLQCGLQFTKTVQAENFPTGVLKQLKDCRKRMSSTAIKDLYEMYLSHLKVSHPEILKNAKDISEFVRECLELCWLMAIQDPPVVFAPVAQPGSDFNTDIFKAYTSSGKHVDYTVLPAMLLHKGGPILSKGIAQGYGKKTSKFLSR